MVDLPELRSVVRQEAVFSSAAVVVRGGPDTDLKLRTHALRTARAFTFDGGPAFGVSVFAAVDDIGAASLEPHMTLLLAGLGQVEPLRDLLGRVQPNPHYGEMTGRRRR